MRASDVSSSNHVMFIDLTLCIEAFAIVLEALGPVVYAEEDFIADFLQINDAALTFADYMGLENYFRRQAARSAGLSVNTLKLVRGAMDLIFGFLPAELKMWLDSALAKDKLYLLIFLYIFSRAYFLSQTGSRHGRLLREIPH